MQAGLTSKGRKMVTFHPEAKSETEMKTLFEESLPDFFKAEEQSEMTSNQKVIWEEFKSEVWKLVRSISAAQWVLIYKIYRLSNKAEAANKS